ncbi:MAG: hypothetical protein AABX03_01650 [Nanoarchaeota archaeon]
MIKREIIGGGPYAVSETQQFTDKKGRLVRVTRDSPLKPIPIGKAYSFFDYNGPISDIEKEIPKIRELSLTPNELELSLMEMPEFIGRNSGWLDIPNEAIDAIDQGIKYVMEASYPNADNKKTAGELATIMDRVYQSQLYKKGEKIRCHVLYKEKGNYVSVE